MPRHHAIVLLLLFSAACAAPTAEKAEAALDNGRVDEAITIAKAVIVDNGPETEYARRILDEARLRQIMALEDLSRAIVDYESLSFHSDHHAAIARSHVEDIARHEMVAFLDAGDAAAARLTFSKLPKSFVKDLTPLEIRLLAAEADACSARGDASCVLAALQRLHELAPSEADAEQNKLAVSTWSDEEKAWHAVRDAHALADSAEACQSLRAASSLNASVDAAHHKEARARHLLHCDGIDKRLAEQELTAERATRRAMEREVAARRRAEVASSKAQSPRYGSSNSFSGYRSGPNCRKGCRCGNSCISCSKTCRH